MRNETWDDHYDNVRYLFVGELRKTPMALARIQHSLMLFYPYSFSSIDLHFAQRAALFNVHVMLSTRDPRSAQHSARTENNICERKLKSCCVRNFEIYVTQGSNVLIRTQHTIMTAAVDEYDYCDYKMMMERTSQ